MSNAKKRALELTTTMEDAVPPGTAPGSPKSHVQLRDVNNFKPNRWTVGTYLAARLYEIGLSHYFVVPGDYNLTLIDELLKCEDLKMISCCNELNAGYAADGYARAYGAACVVVTYTVGGLSLINAVAGAYSDHLPVLVISGGLNSNDFGSNRILHHTTGLAKKNQQFEMFEKVCAYSAVISHISGAKHLIDRAFHAMMTEKKPVYLEISCNLALELTAEPCPFFFKGISSSSTQALELALQAAKKHWDAAVKPVIVGGVQLRANEATNQFYKFADAANCAVAVQPNAKGMFREDHKNFIGTYWGTVSTPGCANIIESSDLYVFVGPVFNDYTTVGYSALLSRGKMMVVRRDRVTMPDGAQFSIVRMKDFLAEFAKIVTPKNASMEAYHRFKEPDPEYQSSALGSPLLTKHIQHHVQLALTTNHAVIVETGDAWFHGQRLRLPSGCGYEFQMQYGSIGWSVGALLGYSLAVKGKKRCLALIGDGSFQMTAQEVSTMIRYECDPIIVLLNNRGYTIEVEIHDGPYNVIKNWDYVKFVEALSAGEGKAKAKLASTEAEFVACLKEAHEHDGLFLIECTLDKDDCTAELLEWGARVAAANSRKHKELEEVL